MHESTKTPTPTPGQGGDLEKTLVESRKIPPPLGISNTLTPGGCVLIVLGC